MTRASLVPRPIVIDCDPGVDDALALLLAAAHPEALDLLAVTTVAGNADIDTTTRNAGAMLALFGRETVPLFRGAHRPILSAQGRRAPVHGGDGLGGEIARLEAEGCGAVSAHAQRPAWQALSDIVRHSRRP